MADLLTDAEKEEVFAALKDVTDTFHKDIILLNQPRSRFTVMDTSEKLPPNEVELLCRVNKVGKKEDSVSDVNGLDDRNEIEIRFYGRYLKEHSLLDSVSNVPNINIEKDTFYWEGIKYRCSRWGNDNSDFMGESAIFVFYCQREDQEPGNVKKGNNESSS